MTRVKICGLTNVEDALAAVALGADAIGMVFAKSPRQISPHKAREISQALPPFVTRIGVFVNSDLNTITGVADYCDLDVIQLHGDKCWEVVRFLTYPFLKALAVKDCTVLEEIRIHHLRSFLLDAYDSSAAGGTGKMFDWRIAKEASSLGKVILSGGLTPDNIGEALESVQPYAVDVCSGVEKEPGIKDHDRMRRFFDEVHTWDSRIH
jgi:phosphoribosylanthranilate isomerase